MEGRRDQLRQILEQNMSIVKQVKERNSEFARDEFGTRSIMQNTFIESMFDPNNDPFVEIMSRPSEDEFNFKVVQYYEDDEEEEKV